MVSVGSPSIWFLTISLMKWSWNSATKYFKIYASSTFTDRIRLADLSEEVLSLFVSTLPTAMLSVD